MIVAGIVDRAIDGSGEAVSSDGHSDLSVCAHGAYVRLLSGHAGDKIGFELLPSDARKLAQELIDQAEKVDGKWVEISSNGDGAKAIILRG